MYQQFDGNNQWNQNQQVFDHITPVQNQPNQGPWTQPAAAKAKKPRRAMKMIALILAGMIVATGCGFGGSLLAAQLTGSGSGSPSVLK